MPNCRLFHTIEKNIFSTVKNWWSLTYGQVYNILIYFMYFIPLHSFTIANETIKENLKKTVPTGQDTLRKNQKM